ELTALLTASESALTASLTADSAALAAESAPLSPEPPTPPAPSLPSLMAHLLRRGNAPTLGPGRRELNLVRTRGCRRAQAAGSGTGASSAGCAWRQAIPTASSSIAAAT